MATTPDHPVARSDEKSASVPASEAELVFNIVFTPSTFVPLQLFTESLLAHSEVGLRLVANGCGGRERRLMRDFVRRYHGRVVEVRELSGSQVVPHGQALEEVYRGCPDGDFFCFVDPDIKANGRFMDEFLDVLPRCAAVTSGKELWVDDSVLPAGAMGVAGRHFVDRDGFVYGGSYMAIYRRAAVDGTSGRWGVGFKPCTWQGLGPETRRRLTSISRVFGLYDTAKALNILLQADGHVVLHLEHEQLVHIGGLATYLSGPRPQYVPQGANPARLDFAAFAVLTLERLMDGEPPPPVPAGIEPDAARRHRLIREELVDLVARYGRR